MSPRSTLSTGSSLSKRNIYFNNNNNKRIYYPSISRSMVQTRNVLSQPHPRSFSHSPTPNISFSPNINQRRANHFNSITNSYSTPSLLLQYPPAPAPPPPPSSQQPPLSSNDMNNDFNYVQFEYSGYGKSSRQNVNQKSRQCSPGRDEANPYQFINGIIIIYFNKILN